MGGADGGPEIGRSVRISFLLRQAPQVTGPLGPQPGLTFKQPIADGAGPGAAAIEAHTYLNRQEQWIGPSVGTGPEGLAVLTLRCIAGEHGDSRTGRRFGSAPATPDWFPPFFSPALVSDLEPRRRHFNNAV